MQYQNLFSVLKNSSSCKTYCTYFELYRTILLLPTTSRTIIFMVILHVNCNLGYCESESSPISSDTLPLEELVVMKSSCSLLLFTRTGFVCRVALLPVVIRIPVTDCCFLVTFCLDALIILIVLMSFTSFRLTGNRIDRGFPDTGVKWINCLNGVLVVIWWLFWRFCVTVSVCCDAGNTSAKRISYMYNFSANPS